MRGLPVARMLLGMKMKSVLASISVMLVLNFQKHFMLMVDASDIGACTVLMQYCMTPMGSKTLFAISPTTSEEPLNHREGDFGTSTLTTAFLCILEYYEVSHCIYGSQSTSFINNMKNHDQMTTLAKYYMDIRHIREKENVIYLDVQKYWEKSETCDLTYAYMMQFL